VIATPAFSMAAGSFAECPGEEFRSLAARIEDRIEPDLNFLAGIRLRVIDLDLKRGKTLL
jgi:hypothetical protein